VPAAASAAVVHPIARARAQPAKAVAATAIERPGSVAHAAPPSSPAATNAG
jgi:hypothetical protein